MPQLTRFASANVDCWVLTGATGLVGRFVLADLLRAGQLVAAMVRARAAASAAARVEECLAPFETEVALLRPRTIAFNLNEAGLGVSEADRRWLSKKRLGVIHSAASIRFSAATPEDEPYLSNVGGTRNLLDFLRDYEVDCFHYVSTAYVSNKAVLDSEMQLPRREVTVRSGLNGGNDYETSKIASERMVSECEWLKTKTILRPSIIVGDSRTGYTSTFHGFYAPLQIASQLVKLPGGSQLQGAGFRKQLGLSEADSKNIVPVDWVAKAIVRIAMDKQLHGAIYHLTNPQPVSCAAMQTAIEQSIREVSADSAPAANGDDGDLSLANLPIAIEAQAASSALFANVREQLAVYESYFNCDPQFDCRSTQAALPDLPCPPIDVDRLTKLAVFALQSNFGWPKTQVVMAEYAPLFSQLSACEPLPYDPNAELIQLQVLGHAAPPPLCLAKHSDRWRISEQSSSATAITAAIVAASNDIAGSLTGEWTLGDLMSDGRCLCFGNPVAGWPVTLQELTRDLRQFCKPR